jgi:uncharacterized protein YndB with AHSA1/START domain
MNVDVSIAPVRKSVHVPVPPQDAFRVFTDDIDRWWPKDHGLDGPVVQSVIEPFVGGRWYARYASGREIANGHVLAWEVPDRVLFSWEISSEWKPDPDSTIASEVEVRFTADRDGTLVEVEHRRFHRMSGGEKMRTAVDGGWSKILALYAGIFAKQGGKAG